MKHRRHRILPPFSNAYRCTKKKLQIIAIPADAKTEKIDNKEKSFANIQLNAFTGGFNTQKGIPFDEIDYFELIDWTGRAVHPKKKGFIPEELPTLLTRLGLSKEAWIETVSSYEKHFSDYVGHEARMRDVGASRGMKWLRGLRACRRLFSTSTPKANIAGALVVG